MDKSKTLDDLVIFGIETALSLAKTSPNDYDFSLIMTKAFSEYLNCSEEDVKNLYNPFHWYFFCRPGHFSPNGYSPITFVVKGHSYAQMCGYEKNDSYGIIKKQWEPNEKEVLDMTSDIISSYRGYLESNISKINISHQQF